MSSKQDNGRQLQPTVLESIAREERADARFTRWALVVAAVLHVVVFAIHWPTFAGTNHEVTAKHQKIFVVRQVKFQPPVQPERPQIPRPRIQKVPIPDPTPDDPEPLRDEQENEDLEFVIDEEVVFGVPDEPPPPEPTGPIRYTVGGNITRPVKISGPNPIYPEAARRARIEGVVMVECIIGVDGRTRECKVLRGLPLGLSEAAVDAVSKWQFRPATLNGKPIDVIYTLRVTWNLQ